MSRLSEKASYLKGLAEGLKLNPEKDSNRMLLELLDLAEETARELEALAARQDDLAEYAEAIDDDLTALEDDIYGEDEDEDEDDEEDDEDDEEGTVTYVCPHCGSEIELSLESLDLEEDMPCPACGKPLFPEGFGDEVEEIDGDEEPEEDGNEKDGDK